MIVPYIERSNQSFLKEINWAYSLEGLLLKLKLIQRANSLGKTLVLRKIEGKRQSGWQRMSWLDSISDSMDMNLSKLWEIVVDRGVWCDVVIDTGHWQGPDTGKS